LHHQGWGLAVSVVSIKFLSNINIYTQACLQYHNLKRVKCGGKKSTFEQSGFGYIRVYYLMTYLQPCMGIFSRNILYNLNKDHDIFCKKLSHNLENKI
jgi:hypothetical protein